MRLIQHSSAEKARPYRNTKVVPVPICCVSWHVCNVKKKRYAKEMEKSHFYLKKKRRDFQSFKFRMFQYLLLWKYPAATANNSLLNLLYLETKILKLKLLLTSTLLTEKEPLQKLWTFGELIHLWLVLSLSPTKQSLLERLWAGSRAWTILMSQDTVGLCTCTLPLL